VRKGEVRADLDLELVADTLKAAYAWNYRKSAAAGGTTPAAELSAMMDRQILVIAEGWRPR
jgi:hypothetical protein